MLIHSLSQSAIFLVQKIPELQKEIELLQAQKLDVEKQAQAQKRELRGKLRTDHSELTKYSVSQAGLNCLWPRQL